MGCLPAQDHCTLYPRVQTIFGLKTLGFKRYASANSLHCNAILRDNLERGTLSPSKKRICQSRGELFEDGRRNARKDVGRIGISSGLRDVLIPLERVSC